jgi:phage repressor protein C with HTH and peptisase S24 domain
MKKYDQFAGRLKLALGEESVHAFGVRCGLASSLVRRYANGEGLPGTEHLVNIAEKAGVNIEWLATGNGPMKKDDTTIKELIAAEQAFEIVNMEGQPIKYRPDPDLYHLPVMSVEAACGNGVFVDEEIATAVFSATRQWFRRELGRNPEQMCLIKARGDSMADTIMPEELVFVDHSCAQESADGIWVFRHQDNLFIKRLQFLPDWQVAVNSDNPRYQNYIIDQKTDFRLLGQVIAALPFRRL